MLKTMKDAAGFELHTTFLPLTESTPESTHSVRPVPRTTTSYSGAISSMFVMGLLKQVIAQMNWWNRRGESVACVYGGAVSLVGVEQQSVRADLLR